MKPIFIRKENFNWKELMEALEKETSVVSRSKKFSPRELLKLWPVEAITRVHCDNVGISGNEIIGQEIHCMKDFVEIVKEQFPKKEEEFCVDLRYVNTSKLLKEIEETSSILWFSKDSPTQCTTRHSYLETREGALLNIATSENKTELTPAQFIKKCAELCPPKSVYDDLKKGDVCLVSHNKNHGWRVGVYKDNKFFVESTINMNTDVGGATWKQVKPTGVNVYDVLKGEN